MVDKPELLVDRGNLPATAAALRDLFVAAGCFFDRDMPVKMVQQPIPGAPPTVEPLDVNSVTIEAHRLCQPVIYKASGEKIAVTLPERVARLFLAMRGEWYLPPLTGISTAPLLANDGSIRYALGYDSKTSLWCCTVPTLSPPGHPQRADAAAALRLLRDCFKTFPFADAARRNDFGVSVDVVDLSYPPGRDESAFLAGLLTAICRPSLGLAPGLLVCAPLISGAGTGKGLLIRAICAIAFGVPPRAFTRGHDLSELDKRIGAELVEAFPALFLDNVNDALLRSEVLASVLTERPARIRLLGETRMVTLNSTSFIAITGNGLRPSEDLARRFTCCNVDAHCEDPEQRRFAPHFLAMIEKRREELLSAALTIWRYGRQRESELERGRPLGSFEQWCAWVRDPLLTLGCRDPVEQIEVVKAQDSRRQRIAELFRTWDACHGDAPVKAADLDGRVARIIDPQGRGRQFVASYLGGFAGTRAAGFVLTRQDAAGVWGAATYALSRTSHRDDIEHRDHRDHQTPMVPMVPMPDDIMADNDLVGGDVDVPPLTETVL